MPEWLIERGIGESRAARIVDDEIVEARILLDGIERSGTRLPARLIASRPRAIAEAAAQQYLLPGGAPGVSEGAKLVIEVTREAIPGAEPWKRALAKIAKEAPAPAPELTALATPFPAPEDLLGKAGWNDLVDEARSGIVAFPGGELRISPTPAMTLIDVDGYLAPRELALAGAAAAARAILRLDIGGSIGIDLPTVAGRADRQAIGEAIDAILLQPFERTAVNGFGFVQIVRPRRRASLLELAEDRAAFEARALLRRAALEGSGARRLVAHPAVVKLLEARPGWTSELARQVGGAISLRADAALPMSSGYAENT